MTGQELKAIRRNLGISQGAMAKKLSVAWQTVQRWEKQETIPVMAGLAVQQIVMTRAIEGSKSNGN